MDNMSKDKSGVSLDCGTMNFVSAKKINGKIQIFRIRNAFIDLPIEHKRMLKLSNTSFVELEGKLLVLGDQALDTANLFNREARRPMSAGIIAPGEIEAQQVISIMMKKILGDPKVENERCCYSVPASAVDVQNSDITYHSLILKKIINELGFSPEPANEALAVILSELASDNFSGIGISYGAGMTNVCLAYNTMSALEFSLSKAGDWADEQSAKAVGLTKAKMTSIKEDNIDISHPQNRNQEALSLYIQTLIDYSIDGIIKHFHKVRSDIMIPKPVPIVISGGTSLAGGFLEKFKERFNEKKSNFPISISEIKQAKDPLFAVSTGLLTLAQMDDEE